MSEAHGTQVPEDTSQTGVAPVHAVRLVAEHWPQAPLGWQAGAAALQLRSEPQGTQAPVPRSHTGVEPPHCESAAHGPQAPVAVLHTGVTPAQAEVLVDEH